MNPCKGFNFVVKITIYGYGYRLFRRASILEGQGLTPVDAALFGLYFNNIHNSATG